MNRADAAAADASAGEKQAHMNRWHYLDHEPASASENMAWDEFLLDRAERLRGSPVLRLYRFDPPAVTIGYHQAPEAILDLDSLRRDGVDLVRRVTGGRALLHEGELTYCIVAPAGNDALGGGFAYAYASISAAIVKALRSLGVDAALSGGRRGDDARGLTTPCLVSACRHEITAGGKKIVGSAQRMTGRAILQHGSILLLPGSERITAYLKGDWDSLRNRITSVSEECGTVVSEREMRSAVKDAFASSFSAVFGAFDPSPAEREEIRRRAMEKDLEFACGRPAEVPL
jgi:lipoate-protein ligase A